MTATEAQVAAAMEALRCEPNPFLTGHRGTPVEGSLCSRHPGDWTDRGCPVAVQAADAVVAAGPDPATIAADALIWKERFVAAWHFGPAGGEDAPHQALMMEGKSAHCRCGHWPYDFDHIATVMGERLAAAQARL